MVNLRNMKIAVIGSTGRTGKEVIRQALEQGHTVTAILRGDPSRLPAHGSPGLTTVTADVMSPRELEPALAGSDAVISALGPHNTGPTTVVSSGAASALTAMNSAGVKRFLIVSASGPFIDSGDDPLLRYIGKPIVQRILRHGFNDLRLMERMVHESNLDWTIVRPPRLTLKPATGRYRVSVGRNLRFGYTLPYADLAHYLLRTIDDPGSVHAHIYVAK
jgi:putative NADH-flavin reductase